MASLSMTGRVAAGLDSERAGASSVRAGCALERPVEEDGSAGASDGEDDEAEAAAGEAGVSAVSTGSVVVVGVWGAGVTLASGEETSGSTMAGLLAVSGGATTGAIVGVRAGVTGAWDVMLSVESSGGASCAKAEVEPSARTAESAVAAPNECFNT